MKEYPYLSQALSQSIELIRRKRKISKVRLADFSCLERRYLREIELGTKKPTVRACLETHLSIMKRFNSMLAMAI